MRKAGGDRGKSERGLLLLLPQSSKDGDLQTKSSAGRGLRRRRRSGRIRREELGERGMCREKSTD